jgi:hypothetical protein
MPSIVELGARGRSPGRQRPAAAPGGASARRASPRWWSADQLVRDMCCLAHQHHRPGPVGRHSAALVGPLGRPVVYMGVAARHPAHDPGIRAATLSRAASSRVNPANLSVGSSALVSLGMRAAASSRSTVSRIRIRKGCGTLPEVCQASTWCVRSPQAPTGHDLAVLEDAREQADRVQDREETDQCNTSVQGSRDGHRCRRPSRDDPSVPAPAPSSARADEPRSPKGKRSRRVPA